MPIRRSMFIACGLVFTSAFSVLANDSGFPYTAYVHTEEAIVHGGPGSEYAATDKLSWAGKVEVYRHDPGGWCAVRPPEGSFSWLPAESLEMTDDPTLARVIDAEATTRVGSRFSGEPGIEFVKMKVGELVEVHGTRAIDGEKWTKISPPAGEFRWVARACLDKSPPSEVRPTPAGMRRAALAAREEKLEPAAEPALIPTPEPPLADRDQRAATMAPAQSSPPDHERNAIMQATHTVLVQSKLPAPAAANGSAPAPNDATARASAPPNDGWRPAGSTLPTTNADFIEHSPHGALASAAPLAPNFAPTHSPLATHHAPLNDRIDAARLQLSLMVAQDPAHWNLNGLWTEANSIAVAAQGSQHAPAAQALVARIDEFARIQYQRHQLMQAGSANPLAAAAPSASGSAPPAAANAHSSSPWGGPTVTDPAPRNWLLGMAGNLGLNPGGANAPPNGASGNRTVTLEPSPDAAMHAADGESAVYEPVDGVRGASADAELAARFDGSGWLMLNISKRRDLPQWAITNDDGDILHLVSPAPGVNLHRYLRQEVGVTGTRGQIRIRDASGREIVKPHITAERIVLLDRHR